MFVRDLIADGGHSYSFEFFPPKTEAGEKNLWNVIRNDLEPLAPTFVSVTYGAGGSTRDRTVRLVKRIAKETDITPVAHLTCVLADEEELCGILDDLVAGGVHNILALRGDAPADSPADRPVYREGLEHAVDLVRLVKERLDGQVSVGVAAFPEVHPEASDAESDARYLVEKVSAGADFAVTQFFFEAHHYWELLERVGRHGLSSDVPILPGIMPVTNIGQITRMAELSGADFPGWLAERLEAVSDDPDAMRDVGVEVATDLCRELLDGGAPGLHFYTLNRSSATREIYANLGLGPE